MSDASANGCRAGFGRFVCAPPMGEYAVRHPELVLIGPRTLALLDKHGEIVVLDPLHIVALKDLSPKRNGPAKH